METSRSFRKFKKEPLILSIALLAISVSAFWFIEGRINNNKTIGDEAEASWLKEADRREEIRSLDRLVKDVEEEKKELESHFAQSSNVVPFLDMLEKLAFSTSAESEIISVGVSKDKAELLIEMRTTGTFEAVYKYLLLLESSPYQLEFITVDLHKLSGEGADWGGNFKIKLLSFVP